MGITSKEKAKELVDKMTMEIGKFNSKQCALITVDEILDSLKHPPNFNRQVVNINTLKYWQEVKQEIENF